MTTGMVVRGPGAGAILLRMLRALELLGSGAIGGFAVLRGLTPEGRIVEAETQRGGSTGLQVPEGFATVPFAAVISSGPDRPEPLRQFLPAGPGGMVTGHRLPASPLAGGQPVNMAAFEALEAGRLDQAGLEALLAAAPGIDVGLIAAAPQGPVLLANAPRVAARVDCGSFLWQAGERAVALVLNSIAAQGRTAEQLAAEIGATGAAELGGPEAALRFGHLPDSLRVTAAEEERITLDGAGCVTEILSADPRIQRSRPGITAVYSGTPVWQAGRPAGRVVTEVWSDVQEGCLSPGPARAFLWQRGL